MAYDIGPRIGIEGEAEFRKAINNINTNLRTLGTEMLAVTSQFDKNDKSMEALTSQNKVLNKQIDEQKGKLSELQKGLQASAEKYGENDKVTQGWQQAVNKATADLNKMERELKSNTQTIEKGSDATEEITTGVEEFGKSADEAGKKTITFGDIIKANLISEAIIGGVKALGNAMISLAKSGVELAKESLENAAVIGEVEAAYEQVMGDSAGYANEKIKELSNNTGAITSRLKDDFTTQTASWTGLGKSVEEATGLASRSITVAADYAAMYGKTTEEASDRIKSFMNGNLGAAESLGISASAASIASWASKELGIEYDKLEEAEKKIIRLDFVETMAENAGITGQAARESGNYANVMANLDETMENLKARLGEGLLPTMLDVAQGFTGMVDGTLSIKDGMAQLTDVIVKFLSEFTSKIPEIAEAGKEIVTQLVQGIINNLPTIILAGQNILQSIVTTIADNIGLVINTAKNIINGLITGITNTLPNLIPTALSIIIGFADYIISNIGKIVDTGINILLALVQGIVNTIPTLIQEVPRIINEFSNTIYAQMPKILKAGIDILVMLGKGIIDSIPTLIANIPQIIMAIVNVITMYNWWNLGSSVVTKIGNGIEGMKVNIGNIAKSVAECVGTTITNIFKGGLNWGKGLITNIGNGFSSMLSYITKSASSLATLVIDAIRNIFTSGFNIGKDLINGLWNGISSLKNWILEGVGKFAGNILDAFKEKWGIASPSRVMHLFGQYLDEGLAKGIVDNAHKPIGSANTLADNVGTAMQKVGNFVSNTVNIIKKEFQLWKLYNEDLQGSSQELEMQLEMQKQEHELLTEQIKVTESALADITAKYGEGSEQAFKYKSELLDLQIHQAGLTVEIEETTKALKNMADAQTMSRIAAADKQSSASRSASQSKYQQEKDNFQNSYSKEISAYSKMYDVDKGVAAEILKKDLQKSIPKYATGTNNHPGGLAWVGELGRELVQLPRGSKVFTNQQSENIINQASRPINLNLNIGTLVADDYGLKQLERKLRDVRIDENLRLGVTG